VDGLDAPGAKVPSELKSSEAGPVSCIGLTAARGTVARRVLRWCRRVCRTAGKTQERFAGHGVATIGY
jgi:hypothetical protein